MATGLDIVSSALRLINVLASGETPGSAEAADGLQVLNDMVDSWSAERLMIWTVQRQTADAAGNPFNLQLGQQTYAVGPTAPIPFDIPRPSRIDYVGALSFENPMMPLELPLEMLTLDRWSQIPVKNIPSSRPTKCYDDGNFPNRNLSFWPVPSTHLIAVALYVWQAITQFPDLYADFTFPPGYARAIRYNLAVDMAPEYGRAIDPGVAAVAVQSKAVVKSLNTPLVDLYCDAALIATDKRIFNWLTGDTARTGTGVR